MEFHHISHAADRPAAANARHDRTLRFVYSPANGATVSGTRTVSAGASDNIAVSGVQFILDGVNLGAKDESGPFTLAWDTTLAVTGSTC